MIGGDIWFLRKILFILLMFSNRFIQCSIPIIIFVFEHNIIRDNIDVGQKFDKCQNACEGPLIVVI